MGVETPIARDFDLGKRKIVHLPGACNSQGADTHGPWALNGKKKGKVSRQRRLRN